MEDYDPACPTEDDYHIPDIDLSQVPLPPPPPSQARGRNGGSSSKQKQSLADPPPPPPEPEEETGRRGKKKKKKKKKEQARRSVDEDYEEDQEDGGPTNQQAHTDDHQGAENNRREDHRDGQDKDGLPPNDDKSEGDSIESASTGSDKGMTPNLPKEELSTTKPPETTTTPKQPAATTTKMQFKLKTDPESGKAKVSFNLGKSLRRGKISLKTVEKEEKDDKGEDVGGDDDDDVSNDIDGDSNSVKTAGSEVVATRFKVAKKFEMFRPDMLVAKQSLVVQLPAATVLPNALESNSSSSVVVAPVSKSRIINPASAAAVAAINAAIAATETSSNLEDDLMTDDGKKDGADDAGEEVEMVCDDKKELKDDDKELLDKEGKIEADESDDKVKEKVEEKAEGKREKDSDVRNKKSRHDSRERYRDNRDERTKRREEESNRDKERGERYLRRREGRDYYSSDRRTTSSRRSRSGSRGRGRSRSRSPEYKGSLRRGERGVRGERSRDYDDKDGGMSSRRKERDRRGRDANVQRDRSKSRERDGVAKDETEDKKGDRSKARGRDRDRSKSSEKKDKEDGKERKTRRKTEEEDGRARLSERDGEGERELSHKGVRKSSRLLKVDVDEKNMEENSKDDVNMIVYEINPNDSKKGRGKSKKPDPNVEINDKDDEEGDGGKEHSDEEMNVDVKSKSGKTEEEEDTKGCSQGEIEASKMEVDSVAEQGSEDDPEELMVVEKDEGYKSKKYKLRSRQSIDSEEGAEKEKGPKGEKSEDKDKRSSGRDSKKDQAMSPNDRKKDKKNARREKVKDKSMSPNDRRKDGKTTGRESPAEKRMPYSKVDMNESDDEFLETDDNDRSRGRRWHRERWSQSPEKTRPVGGARGLRSDKDKPTEGEKKKKSKGEKERSVSLGEVFLDLSAIPEKSKWEVDEEEEVRHPTIVVEDIDEIVDRDMPRRFPPKRPIMSSRDLERVQGFQESTARRGRASRWSMADSEPREFRDRRSVVEEERRTRSKKGEDRSRGRNVEKADGADAKVVDLMSEDIDDYSEKLVKSSKEKGRKTGSRLASKESSPALNKKTEDETPALKTEIIDSDVALVDQEKPNAPNVSDLDHGGDKSSSNKGEMEKGCEDAKSPPTKNEKKKKKEKRKPKFRDHRSETPTREEVDSDSSRNVRDRCSTMSSPSRKDKTETDLRSVNADSSALRESVERSGAADKNFSQKQKSRRLESIDRESDGSGERSGSRTSVGSKGSRRQSRSHDRESNSSRDPGERSDSRMSDGNKEKSKRSQSPDKSEVSSSLPRDPVERPNSRASQKSRQFESPERESVERSELRMSQRNRDTRRRSRSNDRGSNSSRDPVERSGSRTSDRRKDKKKCSPSPDKRSEVGNSPRRDSVDRLSSRTSQKEKSRRLDSVDMERNRTEQSRKSQRIKDHGRRSRSLDRESNSSRDPVERSDSRASQRSYDRKNRSKSPRRRETLHERRRRRSRSFEREMRSTRKRSRSRDRRERSDSYGRRSRSVSLHRDRRGLRKRSRSSSNSSKERSLRSNTNAARDYNDKRHSKSSLDNRRSRSGPSRSQSPNSEKRHKNKKKQKYEEANVKETVDGKPVADSIVIELDSIPIPGEIPIPPGSPKVSKSQASRSEVVEDVSGKDDLDTVEMEISDDDEHQEGKDEKLREESTSTRRETESTKTNLPDSKAAQAQKLKMEDKNVGHQIKFSIGVMGSSKKLLKPVKSSSSFLNDDDDDENDERKARRRRLPVDSDDSGDDEVQAISYKTKSKDRAAGMILKTSKAMTGLTILTKKPKDNDDEDRKEQEASKGGDCEISQLMPGMKDAQELIDDLGDDDKTDSFAGDIVDDDKESKEIKPAGESGKPRPPERLKFKYIPLWEMAGEERPSPKYEDLEPAPGNPSSLGLGIDYDSCSDTEVDKASNPSPSTSSPEKRFKKETNDLKDGSSIPSTADKNDEFVSSDVAKDLSEKDKEVEAALCLVNSMDSSSSAKVKVKASEVVEKSGISEVYSPSHPSMEDDEDDSDVIIITNTTTPVAAAAATKINTDSTVETVRETSVDKDVSSTAALSTKSGMDLGQGLSILSHIPLPTIVPLLPQPVSAQTRPLLQGLTTETSNTNQGHQSAPMGLPPAGKFRISRFHQAPSDIQPVPPPSVQVLPVVPPLLQTIPLLAQPVPAPVQPVTPPGQLVPTLIPPIPSPVQPVATPMQAVPAPVQPLPAPIQAVLALVQPVPAPVQLATTSVKPVPAPTQPVSTIPTQSAHPSSLMETTPTLPVPPPSTTDNVTTTEIQGTTPSSVSAASSSSSSSLSTSSKSDSPSKGGTTSSSSPLKRPRFSSILAQPKVDAAPSKDIDHQHVSTPSSDSRSVSENQMITVDDNTSQSRTILSAQRKPMVSEDKSLSKPLTKLPTHSVMQDTTSDMAMPFLDLAAIPLPGEEIKTTASSAKTDNSDAKVSNNAKLLEGTGDSKATTPQVAPPPPMTAMSAVQSPIPSDAFSTSTPIPTTAPPEQLESRNISSSSPPPPLPPSPSSPSSTCALMPATAIISTNQATASATPITELSSGEKKKRYLQSPLAIGLLPKIQPQSPLSIGPLPKIAPVISSSKEQPLSASTLLSKTLLDKSKLKSGGLSIATPSPATTPSSSSSASSRIHMVLKNKVSTVSKTIAKGFDDDGSDSEGEVTLPEKGEFHPPTLVDSESSSLSVLPVTSAPIVDISIIPSLCQTTMRSSEVLEVNLSGATTIPSGSLGDGGNAATAPIETYPVKVITSVRDVGEKTREEFDAHGVAKAPVTENNTDHRGGSSSRDSGKDRSKRSEDDREVGRKERRDGEKKRRSRMEDKDSSSGGGSSSSSSRRRKESGGEELEFDLSKVKKEKEDDYEEKGKDKKRLDDEKKDKKKSQSDLGRDKDKHESKRSRDGKGDDRRKRRYKDDFDYDDSSPEKKRGSRRERSKSRSYERDRPRDWDSRSRDKNRRRSRERSWERDEIGRKGVGNSSNSHPGKRSRRSRERSISRSPSNRRRDGRYERNRSWERDADGAGSGSGRGSRNREGSRSRDRDYDRKLGRIGDGEFNRKRSRSRDRDRDRRSMSLDSDRGRDSRRRSRSLDRKMPKRKSARSAKEDFLEEVSKIDAAISSQVNKGDKQLSYNHSGVTGSNDDKSRGSYYPEPTADMYPDSHNAVYGHEQQAQSIPGSTLDYSGMAGFEGQGQIPTTTGGIPGQAQYNPYDNLWQQQPPHEQYNTQAQQYPPGMPVDDYMIQQQQQQPYPPHYQQEHLHHPHNVPPQQSFGLQQFPNPPQQQYHHHRPHPLPHHPQPPPPQQQTHAIPLPDPSLLPPPQQQTYQGMPLPPETATPAPPDAATIPGFQTHHHPPAQTDYHQQDHPAPPPHLQNTFQTPSDQNNYNLTPTPKGRTLTPSSTPPINPRPQTTVSSSSSSLSSSSPAQTNSKALPDSRSSPAISRADGKPRKSRFSPLDTSNILAVASIISKDLQNQEMQDRQMSSTDQTMGMASATSASIDTIGLIKDERAALKGDTTTKKSRFESEDAAAMVSMVSSSGVEDTQGDNSEENNSGAESSAMRPLKVKSRWRRNSEAEAADTSLPSTDLSSKPGTEPTPSTGDAGAESVLKIQQNVDSGSLQAKEETVEKQEEKMDTCDGRDGKRQEESKEEDLESVVKRPDFPNFEIITENIHLTERKRSKSMKRMTCDCTTSREDRSNGIPACGSDCLNRMLMIECGSRCPCGDHCTNKRFQRKQYSKTIPLKTDEKGWGLQAMEDMPDGGTFVMEYVGELLGYDEFVRRTKQYSKAGMIHHYFMALNADEVVDATLKGSISRFINHSCDPNCETQKWTVNGELRVGFFTRKPITKGDELTFDYQFEHYGEAQRCYCGADKCRGYIGLVKSSSNKQTASKKKDKKKKAIFQDELLEEDISLLSQLDGMRNKNHVLELCRVMVRAEKVQHRVAIVKIIQATKEPACLRLFLDYHGLSLFWSWMTDINTADYSDDTEEFKLLMLSVLKALPITNKTMLKESKILPVVERWAVAAVAAARKPPPPPPPTSTTAASTSSSSSTTTNSSSLSSSDVASTSSSTTTSSTTTAEAENVATAADSNNEADSVVQDAPQPSASSSSTTIPTPCTSTSPPPSSSSSSSPPSTPLPLPASLIIPVSILSSAEKPKDGRKKRRVTFAEEHMEASFSPEPEDTGSISSSTPYEECYGEAAPLKDHSLLAEETEDSQNGNSGVPGEADSTSQKDLSQDDTAGVSSDTDTSDVEYLTKDPLTSLASELLCSWSGLKEVFKIPKKERVEERKRTERELDVLSKKQSTLRDPYAKWKKNNARSSRKRSLDEDDRKTSAPKMSKEEREERRQRFEAQVKAEDELAAQAAAEEMQRQQEEFMLHQQRLMEDPQYFYYHQQQQEQQQQQKQQQNSSDGGEIAPPQPVLDPVTGQPMVDPVTGQPILQQHEQQPPQPFIDPITGQPLTPQLDPVTGQPVLDPATGQPLFHDHHHHHHHHHHHPPPNSSMPSSTIPVVDPNTGQPVIDPNTGQLLVEHQLPAIDPSTGQPLVDPTTGQPLIDPNTGQHYIDPNTGQHYIDPNTGQPFIDPNTGQHYIDPNTGQPFIDPSTGQHYIDPNTGQPFVDPNTGQPVHQASFHTHPTDPHHPHNHHPHHPHHHHHPTAPPTSSDGNTSEQIDPVTGQPVVVQSTPHHHHHHVDPITGQPIVAAASQTPPTSSSSSSFIPSQVLCDPASMTVLPPGGMEMEEEVPPPPSPPTVPVTKLPPNWKTAKDAEGRVYYYHAFTRQTQWEMPSWDDNINDSDNEMDLDPMPAEEVTKSSKRKTTTAAADTSSELAKKYKEQFRCKMSSFIVLCLNPFRKSDCKIGRISSTEDFKYLARKLTHHVMSKELKHCRHVEDLEVNENVKAKAKDYVRKYMSKFGSIYRRTGSPQAAD